MSRRSCLGRDWLTVCVVALGDGSEERLLIVYAERYFELLKDAKVKGYLFAQQNYIEKP